MITPFSRFIYSKPKARSLPKKVIEGSYPEKLNEIAVDQAYMKQIGKAAKLGTVLELQNFDGDTETFRVSGFCDSGSSSRIYPILFSKAYAAKGPLAERSALYF